MISPEGEMTSPEGQIISPDEEIISAEGEMVSPEDQMVSTQVELIFGYVSEGYREGKNDVRPASPHRGPFEMVRGPDSDSICRRPNSQLPIAESNNDD